MSKDQINGALPRLHEPAGKKAGSNEQEARRVSRRAQGKLQEACDKVKDVLKNSRHS